MMHSRLDGGEHESNTDGADVDCCDGKRSHHRERANRAREARSRSVLCVLENPSLMVNVASVMRNVDALGVQKLYIVDPRGLYASTWQSMRSDRTLLKASVGAVKWVYTRRFASTTDCLAHLRNNGYQSVATSPHLQDGSHTTLSLADRNLGWPQKKLAIWFGNESNGLSADALAGCTLCVQIPMAGLVESLNLATTTGIVLFTILNARRHQTNRKQTLTPQRARQVQSPPAISLSARNF
jgi:tRNA (guanosine-2'-O-)-methyltransferase